MGRDKGDVETLVVNEVYASVQGEGTRAGRPCAFVRLTGCGLRCTWCDTAYAFHEGARRTVDEVVAEVRAFGLDLVLLTGGEPLEQPGCLTLAARLCDAGLEVTVETGGHVDAAPLDPRVARILDVKCPGSGMERRNHWPNLSRLRPTDEVKFVVADRRDVDYALAVIREHGLVERGCALLFSPVHGALDPAVLSGWLVAARVPRARLNLQLHKLVWPAATRGV
ncbi:MAG: 7-carboxy-7-deazaguanine synthase QueE [Planctomycetes bacterium]|nr:7-carboxy-7-deazaguanine synthase QueE [Planctomycetota bacterium]